jgi:hypothetical protein
MRRIHLFEFTDLSWYPQTFRRIQTDYLQFVATRSSAQKNLVPLLIQGLQVANTTEIVDLCSGGSGPWLILQKQLAQAGYPVKILLTDKYPDSQAVQKWGNGFGGEIAYLPEPIDALQVPPCLKGMRTLFEGFHHFKPDQAQAIICNAVENRAPIGIFEMSLKPPYGLPFLLFAPVMTILAYFVLTPFIRPLTWSRLLWTYLIPVVPLITCWDGIISLLRVYSQQDLQKLTGSLSCKKYIWKIGKVSTGTPVFEYSYLVGFPTPLPA